MACGLLLMNYVVLTQHLSESRSQPPPYLKRNNSTARLVWDYYYVLRETKVGLPGESRQLTTEEAT